MQNIKSTVLSALQTAATIYTTVVQPPFSMFHASPLATLKGIYFFHPPDFTNLPALSYFEVDNIGNLYADDTEAGSEIVFQIDLWGKTSLSEYALAVDDVMTGLDFNRISSPDLYEKDTKIYHKSMRYRIDYFDPNF